MRFDAGLPPSARRRVAKDRFGAREDRTYDLGGGHSYTFKTGEVLHSEAPSSLSDSGFGAGDLAS